jgi:hypothetical protein
MMQRMSQYTVALFKITEVYEWKDVDLVRPVIAKARERAEALADIATGDALFIVARAFPAMSAHMAMRQDAYKACANRAGFLMTNAGQMESLQDFTQSTGGAGASSSMPWASPIQGEKPTRGRLLPEPHPQEEFRPLDKPTSREELRPSEPTLEHNLPEGLFPEGFRHRRTRSIRATHFFKHIFRMAQEEQVRSKAGQHSFRRVRRRAIKATRRSCQERSRNRSRN